MQTTLNGEITFFSELIPRDRRDSSEWPDSASWDAPLKPDTYRTHL